MFAGGSFFQWFPSRGLTSDNWDQLSLFGKIADYLWHLVLPLIGHVARRVHDHDVPDEATRSWTRSASNT